jgi:hypothetical protein
MKTYPSRYSPGKDVSEMQYIIELVCERNAAQTGRQLPLFFWKVSPWDIFYKSQLRKCQSLLKTFSSEAIVKSLRDKRARKVYSLFAPWLVPIIKEYNDKINKPIDKIESPEIGGDNFLRPTNKKTLTDKLNEL